MSLDERRGRGRDPGYSDSPAASRLLHEIRTEVSRRMEDAGAWPPDGIDLHVCFGSEGDLRVSEIWDSEEEFGAFNERLQPILSEVGVQLAGEPEVFEVQELQKREEMAAGPAE